MMKPVRLCRSLLAAAVLSVAVAGTAAANVCATFASEAELEYRIPAGLLQAIALVESKHNPWAVAVGGKSMLPGSQEAAARLIRSRPTRGVFVGCMQLSVKHHEWAFEDMADMLDPAENVDYAAQLLVELRDASGSWTKAVQRYQGGKPAAQRRYVCMVAGELRRINRGSADLFDTRGCSAKDLKSVTS
jgi:hypothetical protein